MLRAIMLKHNIMPEFLETVRAFQYKTCNVEEAFGGTSWSSCNSSLKGTESFLRIKAMAP